MPDTEKLPEWIGVAEADFAACKGTLPLTHILKKHGERLLELAKALREALRVAGRSTYGLQHHEKLALADRLWEGK